MNEKEKYKIDVNPNRLFISPNISIEEALRVGECQIVDTKMEDKQDE